MTHNYHLVCLEVKFSFHLHVIVINLCLILIQIIILIVHMHLCEYFLISSHLLTSIHYYFSPYPTNPYYIPSYTTSIPSSSFPLFNYSISSTSLFISYSLFPISKFLFFYPFQISSSDPLVASSWFSMSSIHSRTLWIGVSQLLMLVCVCLLFQNVTVVFVIICYLYLFSRILPNWQTGDDLLQSQNMDMEVVSP